MSTDTCDGCGKQCTAETMNPVGQAAFCSTCWRNLERQIIREFTDDVRTQGLAAVQRKYNLDLFGPLAIKAPPGWDVVPIPPKGER